MIEVRRNAYVVEWIEYLLLQITLNWLRITTSRHAGEEMSARSWSMLLSTSLTNNGK
jgi:hypothetical protein